MIVYCCQLHNKEVNNIFLSEMILIKSVSVGVFFGTVFSCFGSGEKRLAVI